MHSLDVAIFCAGVGAVIAAALLRLRAPATTALYALGVGLAAVSLLVPVRIGLGERVGSAVDAVAVTGVIAFAIWALMKSPRPTA